MWKSFKVKESAKKTIKPPILRLAENTASWTGIKHERLRELKEKDFVQKKRVKKATNRARQEQQSVTKKIRFWILLESCFSSVLKGKLLLSTIKSMFRGFSFHPLQPFDIAHQHMLSQRGFFFAFLSRFSCRWSALPWSAHSFIPVVCAKGKRVWPILASLYNAARWSWWYVGDDATGRWSTRYATGFHFDVCDDSFCHF